MCTAALVLGTLSAGAGLYQGAGQARAEKAYGEAQASAMERNAAISREQGHDAIERGGLEELRLRRGIAQRLGNQRAQAGASGVDVNSGSMGDVRNATISEGEQDAEAIRFNAAREKWGYDNQAANLQTQANMTRAMSRANASNILTGSVIGFGLNMGQTLYGNTKNTAYSSPLTETTQETSWVDTFGLEHKRRNGRRY